jgi:hypothetical protein
MSSSQPTPARTAAAINPGNSGDAVSVGRQLIRAAGANQGTALHECHR